MTNGVARQRFRHISSFSDAGPAQLQSSGMHYHVVTSDHFISYWRFAEKRTGMVADQTISVIFVELALFTKTLEECVTESDRLFYIFMNSGGFLKIPEWIEEAGGISRRLAEACEVAAFDKKKKLKYKIDKMNEWDILAQREFAERKGFEKGYADGEAKGLADWTAERILALK